MNSETDTKPRLTNTIKVAAALTFLGGAMLVAAELVAWTSEAPYDGGYGDLAFGFTMCCSAVLAWLTHQHKKGTPPSPDTAP